MIDYYLHKKCCLVCKNRICYEQSGACGDCRCKGCTWLDQEIHKCIFAVDYPRSIALNEFKKRILQVNQNQQSKLSNPSRRFIIKE